jgi:CRISPR/Cas system-associated endonuclease Cas1
LCQYESVNNGLGFDIAKKIVYAKLKGQNEVLRKYGFRQFDLMKIKDTIDKADDRQRFSDVEEMAKHQQKTGNIVCRFMFKHSSVFG